MYYIIHVLYLFFPTMICETKSSIHLYVLLERYFCLIRKKHIFLRYSTKQDVCWPFIYLFIYFALEPLIDGQHFLKR
jgi:hypothetical protein